MRLEQEAPRDSPPSYWLTRFFILRLLGLVYLVSFLTAINQGLPLIGSGGLLPARSFLDRVEEHLGSRAGAVLRPPPSSGSTRRTQR